MMGRPTEFVVMLTGLSRSVKCIHEHSQASCVVCFFFWCLICFFGLLDYYFCFTCSSSAVRRNKVFNFVRYRRVWRHLMLINGWWVMTAMSQTVRLPINNIMPCIWLINSWFNQAVFPWPAEEFIKWRAKFVIISAGKSRPYLQTIISKLLVHQWETI